jgi:hypothetical protein
MIAAVENDGGRAVAQRLADEPLLFAPLGAAAREQQRIAVLPETVP